MNKRVKNVIAWIVTAIVLVASVIYAGYVMRPLSVENKLGTIKAFHEVEKNTVDVMVFGNSRAWKSVDTRMLNSEYGISSYNYGDDWMHMETTKLFVKDALKTQQPKLILLEVHKDEDAISDKNKEAEIYYSRQLNSSIFERISYLKEYIGFGEGTFDMWLAYLMPVVGFHEEWSDVEAKSFLPNKTVDKFIESNGYNSSDKIYPVTLYYEGTSDKKLKSDSLSQIKNIVDICHENDVEVLLFTAPYSAKGLYGKSISEFANANDCGYVDFMKLFDEIGLDGDKDFRDSGHLNDSGAGKVTKYLAEYITSNYDLSSK